MKRTVCTTIAMLTLSALLGACGGGGGGSGGAGGGGYRGPPPPPPPPPPAPAAQSPGGIWNGLSAVHVADAFTSFETTATGPFTTGVAPYRATFSTGEAEFRGIAEFYISGSNAWHIIGLTSSEVTFETMPHTLSFWARTVNASDMAEIRILDENGAELQVIVPTDSYQLITENRYPGETVIGSVEVTSTSGDDIVIDDWAYGFLELDALVACVIDELTDAASEFVCVLTDPASGDSNASAQGTIQVTNDDQASGSGTLYAISPFTLSDGSTEAALTVTGGIVDEDVQLVLTTDAVGDTVTLVLDYDANSYDRGSDLATVTGSYAFDLYGDPATFDIDGAGVISGTSMAACIFGGQVSIIDTAFNAYDVALDVASCAGLNGSYDGLGYTADDQGMDDVFIFSVFNATSTIVGEARM